jgi:hypothetical protein
VGAVQADDTLGAHPAETAPAALPTPDLTFPNPNSP